LLQRTSHDLLKPCDGKGTDIGKEKKKENYDF
jgi:hypothetical protein